MPAGTKVTRRVPTPLSKLPVGHSSTRLSSFKMSEVVDSILPLLSALLKLQAKLCGNCFVLQFSVTSTAFSQHCDLYAAAEMKEE